MLNCSNDSLKSTFFLQHSVSKKVILTRVIKKISKI